VTAYIFTFLTLVMFKKSLILQINVYTQIF
jgi:hypothetical protein